MSRNKMKKGAIEISYLIRMILILVVMVAVILFYLIVQEKGSQGLTSLKDTLLSAIGLA